MSHPQVSHLAILDWGIGGFDFYGKVRQLEPRLRITYVSDAGFEPYGRVPEAELTERVEALARAVVANGAQALVVACNAASTVLPRTTLPEGLTTLGVIEPTLARLTAERPTRVAVLGGLRTIESRAYEGPLSDLGVEVRAVVAQPLSALVEAGTLEGQEVDGAIAAVSLGLHGVEVLVPACTHYTALLPQLRRAIEPQRVVDPASETLGALRALAELKPSAKPGLACFSSGDAHATQRAARRAFCVELPAVAPLEALGVAPVR